MIRSVVISAIVLGCVLSVVFGLLSEQGNNKLFFESYKITLAFTLVGILGAVVKAAIDASISQQREESRRYDEWENRRTEMLEGFTHVFSEFYSLRKLHETAVRSTTGVFEDHHYSDLIRECLKRAVDLEGQYGGVKLAIIRHFGLPKGDYGAKSREDLVQLINEAGDPKLRLRHSLDLLGEFYDLWRHKFRESQQGDESDILSYQKKDRETMWSTYEEILEFLETTRFKSRLRKR